MKRLRERAAIERPVEETEQRIITFFETRRQHDGASRMRLHVPMGKAASLGFSLDREVRVEIERTRDAGNLNDITKIAWHPEGTAMLPQFEGALIVWGDDDPGRCFLEIDGYYVPPLGAAGQVFDEAIGHQIAQSTARELLQDIKRWIEAPSRDGA